MTRYLVTYDIADPDRLRRVFQILKGAGTWLQCSVFQCDLTERGRAELVSDLALELNHARDQVLFVDLGPCEGRGRSCIEALGRPYEAAERGPRIV